MNRVDQMQVGVVLDQITQGQADIFKSRAEVFPAMALGLTLISLALIGFGLESRFEPSLRR